MPAPTSIAQALRAELSNWPLWQTRLVVLAFAALSGLTVVALTWLSELALTLFHHSQTLCRWLPLVWTPLLTAALVWLTRRFVPGAAGSGIPQVMAALHHNTPVAARGLFVSLRLSLAKMALTAAGLLGGLSLGREGPSVQVGAGVMLSARRFLPRHAAVTDHGLLIAGGSAGIAAAFNTPLGGIMFAIEELSRRPEQRNNGLVMAAIVLAGLMGVSVFGNATYFGLIRPQSPGWAALVPGLLVALGTGVAGGLFARLLTASLAGTGADRFSRWRHQHPIRFAAGCGLAVAVMGVATQGATFGSGYLHTRELLEGQADTTPVYSLLKFMATWVTAWSGTPGGIFAPSLAIGASLGADIAQLTGYPDAPALIAVGMAGFLAAATQAPLTAFIIVMEMVDGHSMVLSLMAGALTASGVSRLICAPLYTRLAELQLKRLPAPTPPVPEPAPSATPSPPSPR